MRLVTKSILIALSVFAMAPLISRPVSAQVPGEGATDIWRFYSKRVAHIQLVGELYDGTIEVASQGSGFLLDDRYILTSDHVLPNVDDKYRTVRTNVRLESRKSQAILASVVIRDPERDLALLELAAPLPPRPFCPVSTLLPPAALGPGSQLYLMGFPIDRNLTVAPGLLGNQGDGGLWQTDAPLTVGNSGGPVFSSRGFLVGIAESGVIEWTANGRTITVEGIKDLIPITQVMSSPIGDWLRGHVSSDCWQEWTVLPQANQYAWDDTRSVVAVAAAMPAVEPGKVIPSSTYALILKDAPVSQPQLPPYPLEMSTTVTVSRTKDDHGATIGRMAYLHTFGALPDYGIEECIFTATSANEAENVRCDIAADRKSVTFRYGLRSGPFYDRWRGWLRGTITLNQRRITAVDTVKKVKEVAIERMQDAHAVFSTTTERYADDLIPEPGFKIVGCEFQGRSVNNANDIHCQIAPDGKRAQLTYELRSGPATDRWRGWIKGNVTLVMSESR